jgi:hypothetical protein
MPIDDFLNSAQPPPLTPEAMGLSTPPPTPPVAPQAPVQAQPSGILQMLLHAAPAILAGGLGPGAGTGLAQGMVISHHERQRQQQQDFENQQQQYAMQEQDYRQQVALRQQQERQRDAILQQNLTALRSQVKDLPDKDAYDRQVEAYANGLQGMGYRLDSNWLRQAVPYAAPKTDVLAAKAIEKWQSLPNNKKLLTDHPEQAANAMIPFDRDGDGVPESVRLQDLATLAGMPLAQSADGVVFSNPGTTKPQEASANGILQQLIAKAKAEGKQITPDLVIEYQKQAIKTAKEALPETAADEVSPADVDGTARAIVAHRMAPSQLSLAGGMGKAGVKFKQQVLARVQQLDPAFNFQEAESNFQFGKSTGTQTTVRLIDNIEQSIPVLLKASDDFQRSGVRFINQATLAVKDQFGDTSVSAFNAARLGLADEIAKILSGGGTGSTTSDSKLKQANELLSGDMTPGQLRATVAEVQTLLKNRRASLTKGTYMAGSAPTASPSGGPQVGERRNFNGQIGEWDGRGWKAVH